MSNHILACVISGEKPRKREKGEVVTDSKVTILRTDVERRALLPLRTITAITEQQNPEVARNLRGRRGPGIRSTVGSDEV